MKAMVLAAGRGERMRPITDHIPKPLVPVAGKPLIAYHLESLARAGIRDIVINLAYRGAQIREALADGSRYGVRIAYSEEGPDPIETGGGLFKALPLLGPEPFLVVNGDVWTDFDFTRLPALDEGALARLVMVPNPPHIARGDFGLEGDYLTEGDANRCTYSGIGIFSSELFSGCQPGKFPLLPLFRRAISARRLRGQLHSGIWLDIGTPERLVALEDQLRSASRSQG
jgi:N-acetyl-alpha-D-muramate 1-phosphate uridylyltransferase